MKIIPRINCNDLSEARVKEPIKLQNVIDVQNNVILSSTRALTQDVIFNTQTRATLTAQRLPNSLTPSWKHPSLLRETLPRAQSNLLIFS